MVWEDASFAGFPRNTPAPANYFDWRSQQTVFDDMAALNQRSFALTGDGEPEKVSAYGVTASFFPLLGVNPVLGRVILPEDDAPEANHVVVLSYGLWQRRYGGEPNILGRELLLNGEKHTVVGVMPKGFQFLESYIGLWVPMVFGPEASTQRGNHYLTVVARMKEGVTLERANGEIQTIQRRIAQDHPGDAGRISAYVMPLREQLAGETKRPLFVLLVAVAFVLLIACANIANLLLSHAASRRREIAVRAALGASRRRIVRQLITESLLLSTSGAALGLLLAAWTFNFLRQLIPNNLALITDLHLDLPVLGYTLLISCLTGLVFSLAPTLQASKIDLNGTLKQGARSGLSGQGSRLRSSMVIAEVALALVLLVGAGLLIQTFLKLRDQYSGMQPQKVLTMRTTLSGARYKESLKRMAFYDQVLARVEALPGITSAGYTTSIPLEWKGGTSGFVIEGRSIEQARADGLSYDANHREVSPDYLRTIGIPLRSGRYPDSRDTMDTPHVAVINETMAREYWSGEDPLGKRFKLGDPWENVPWITVVGIVGDVRQMGVDQPVKAEMYLPHRQPANNFYAPRDLVVRTSLEPMSLSGAIRHEIQQVDPEQPVGNIRLLDDVLEEQTLARRLGMTLLTIFAGLALMLALLGVYGVLAYFVAQHTPEIGVRIALGAQQRDILGLILRRGMSLVGAGVAIGVGVSLVLTRLMAGLLYGVGAADPKTFASLALVVIAAALMACYLPARRASRVDPVVALREE
jgi:predicted permease